MSTGVKITIYVILVSLTCITGVLFFKHFGQLFEEEKPAAQQTAPPAVEGVNQYATDNPTNALATNTNAPMDTNVVAQTGTDPATNTPAANPNAVAAATDTNAPPAAIDDPTAAAPTEIPTASSAKATGTGQPQGKSRVGLWTGSSILCIIALGAFIAWDVSNFMGSRTLKVLYNDDDPDQKPPEYDEAEQMWANGQPLEAVRMMRDYLNKNPREVHVALRIAEIYEKDLQNNLAAALEYEEVLKQKLPDERWGWAAIHLCNLYFKLGQEDKGYAILQRIVKDYGETQAADKARKRLADAAPHLLEQVESGESAPDADEEEPAPPPRPAQKEAPKQVSNLPPGFRPKK